LEHLELVDCGLLTANKISSKSLKHLSLTDCGFDSVNSVCIYTPSLVSLCLDDLCETTPTLDSMPSLVKAFVRITEECADVCAKLLDPEILDCICQLCNSSENTDGSGSSVLLRGLSQAKSLVLISEPDQVKLHFASITLLITLYTIPIFMLHWLHYCFFLSRLYSEVIWDGAPSLTIWRLYFSMTTGVHLTSTH
jgi:Zn finger protein HypA/HybF involved in hydrogenase expression